MATTLSNGQIIPANLAELTKTLTEFKNKQFPEPAPTNQLSRLQDEVTIKKTAEITAETAWRNEEKLLDPLFQDMKNKEAALAFFNGNCDWRKYSLTKPCKSELGGTVSQSINDGRKKQTKDRYDQAKSAYDAKVLSVNSLKTTYDGAKIERIEAERLVNAYPPQFQSQLDAWSVRKGAFDKQKGLDVLALTEAINKLTATDLETNTNLGLAGKKAFDAQVIQTETEKLNLDIQAINSGAKVSANVKYGIVGAVFVTIAIVVLFVFKQ